MHNYYVYSHKDPRNLKVCYVGIGQYDRAWSVRTNHRSKEHVSWIEELYNLGYTLSDIVQIDENQLTKQEAMELEAYRINEQRPIFNKLLNPEHWNLNRSYDKELASFAKDLHSCGYGYMSTAFLMGADKGKKHMTIKGMINNAI